MALINMYKAYRLNSYISSLLRSSLALATMRRKSMLVEADIMDDFTTQLMQKKVDKWETLKIKRQLPISTNPKSINKEILGPRISDTSINELNAVFEKFIDENDQDGIFVLLEECITYKRCPSELILTNALSSFSQSANIEGINKVQELCSILNETYLKANSNFKHLLAEAIWLKGNVSKSISIFEEVYHDNPFLRRKIRLILRCLILDAVSNRSEAVLVNLITFTERLAKSYKDYYVMACLWQACFLSEWFSDQQVAFNLMEKNHILCKEIQVHIPHVVSISLKQHKTEPVYRLLELLLKYDMKLQSSIVLVVLFDYRYRQGNLSSCCEILNWSSKYKILLPSIQHEKFLRLLLKGENTESKPKQTPPKYELKF